MYGPHGMHFARLVGHGELSVGTILPADHGAGSGHGKLELLHSSCVAPKSATGGGGSAARALTTGQDHALDPYTVAHAVHPAAHATRAAEKSP
jgi:hypothetical protein